jgi:hypothetical protein
MKSLPVKLTTTIVLKVCWICYYNIHKPNHSSTIVYLFHVYVSYKTLKSFFVWKWSCLYKNVHATLVFHHKRTTICLLQHFCKFKSSLWRGVLNTTLCDKVCQWLVTGRWFFQGTMVSSTNKTNCHDITEILLKVYKNVHATLVFHHKRTTICLLQHFTGII